MRPEELRRQPVSSPSPSGTPHALIVPLLAAAVLPPPVCIPLPLAVAVFTFSPACVPNGHCRAAASRADTQPAPPDELVQEPKALGSITISGARESASTRLPLTPRETPQSTSTVTRAQIERQSLTSIDAVLRNVNGIAVSFYDTQRPLYYARGFQITDFQTDGLPSYSSSTNQEFDTALYERIDIVRGANGIQTGVGVPSATINMIRKAPAARVRGLCGTHGGLVEPVPGRAGPERTAQQRRQRAQPPGGGPAEERELPRPLFPRTRPPCSRR